MKVLIVEDESIQRHNMRDFLESKGCEVIDAENGVQGLEMALEHQPDLIICDGQMDKMDGFQLLREIKMNESLKSTPFIFYTATYTGIKERKLALDLGANMFLVKGDLTLYELWEELKSVLGTRKPASTATVEDEKYLNDYSHVVASKLQKKIKELESEVTKRKQVQARLTEIEEQERRRIARELHDQVLGNLTALGLNLNLLHKQMGNSGAKQALACIDESRILVKETVEQVRTVMADLRPSVLDDHGLIAAIQEYVKRFSARTGIAVDLQIPETISYTEGDPEIVLYRILQEALTNVAKHSKATRTVVTVQMENGVTNMIVSDNGVGFDRTQCGSHEKTGYGLLNMEERAQSIGGMCWVESRPGSGTRIIVEV